MLLNFQAVIILKTIKKNLSFFLREKKKKNHPYTCFATLLELNMKIWQLFKKKKIPEFWPW